MKETQQELGELGNSSKTSLTLLRSLGHENEATLV